MSSPARPALIESIPPPAAEKLEAETEPNEKVLVRIAGDLSEKLHFGERYVVVTDKRVLVLDPTADRPLEIPLEEISGVRLDPLVGGARLVLERSDEDPVAIYVSNAAATTFADAAEGIEQLRRGQPMIPAKKRERQRCDTCDRFLPDKSGVCPFCVDKRVTVRRILSWLKPYKPAVAALVPLMVLGIGVDMLFPWIVARIIDDVVGKDKGFSDLLIFVFALIGAKFLASAIGHVRGWLTMWLSSRVTTDVRVSLCRALLRKPVSFYDERQTGMLVSRFTDDAGRLQGLLANDVPSVFIHVTMLVGILAFLFYRDWALTLWILAPMPFAVAGTLFFWKRMNREWARMSIKWARLAVHLGETLAGVRVVKAFSGEDREILTFEENNQAVFEGNIRAELRGFAFFSGISFVMSCGTLLAWYIGGRRVLHGEFSVGALTALLAYLWMLYGPLQWLAQMSNSLTQALVGAERIFGILDSPAEAFEDDSATAMPRIEGAIRFENVTFAYEPGCPVLKSVSLEVKPGEVIGIVGRSGAGKTTAVNLLCRFHDVDEGRILVDGVDVRKIKLEDLRAQIGVVLQDSVLWSGTVTDNIRYGRPKATFDEVREVAKMACAHDFVMTKADGYDSEVGERGCRLSGGEKQRVAIARALLRNPRILVMDEATSSLDTQTEKSIQEALRALMKGRTTFIIAHRLATIREADRIVVVDNGRLAEVGTHAELMEKKGIFYELVQLHDQVHEGAASPVQTTAETGEESARVEESEAVARPSGLDG